MRGFRRRSFLAVIAISGLTVVIWAIAFGGALSWVNKPFAGFLIYRPPYVGSISVSDWPGREAGLSFLERVVAADGKPVVEGQDVISLARSKSPGTLVRYVVESKGTEREVTVPVAVFSIKDFFLAFLVTTLGGMILYVLGVVVVFLKPNLKPSWVFFAMCLGVGGYMVTSFESLTTYILLPFHYLALSFMPAPFLHLALIFPDRKRILERLPYLEYLGYVPAVILSALYMIFYFTLPQSAGPESMSWFLDYKNLGTMARVFALFSVVSLVLSVCHSLYKASSPSARQRAKVILFGLTIAFLPSTMIMMGFYFMKVNFPWNFLVFFIIFFPASIAYSIVKHNLFDADAVIKRTVGYVVATALVVGAYAVVSIGLTVFFGKYQLAQSQAFPILFTLAVIFVFNPLRNRVQALVDVLFFRKEYDPAEVIDKIGRAMTSVLDHGKIISRLIQTFMEDMFISTSSVMLLNPSGVEYRVYLAGGEREREVNGKTFGRDDPLVQIVEKNKAELTKDDILEDPQYSNISQRCAKSFEAVHASLMVPLVFQDQVIGLINLGEKKSGKSFNREDVEVIRSLANQGAVAIENARLFKENLDKQRMEEELNIARDLQISMLPSVCPQVPGFSIAATSIPAREVGGDFFDFIDMGEAGLAFVVGDVTGKSVSGALVMSSSRSVFRMLSEEQLSVGDIMVRANKRIKKDIKAGMFVALLYAVLDGQNKTLSFCSAGQTLPILFSSRIREASLIETVGDNFPLGILDATDYQETQIRLEPGDRVVFYTDGIVEAMNDQKEILGFDRIMKVVEKAGAMSAEALLNHILDEVKAFAGTAQQHDDITVIVVSADE